MRRISCLIRKAALSAVLLCLSALFGGCADEAAENRRLEAEIRGLTVSHSAHVAGLALDMLLTKVYTTPHLFYSDDIYMRTDKVSLIYGFELPENAVSVEGVNGVRTLRVKLRGGRRISINRENVELMTNYDNYLLTVNEKDGGRTSSLQLDVDEEFNREIERLEEKYRARNLEAAGNNLRSFFALLAAKYGLALSLEFVDN